LLVGLMTAGELSGQTWSPPPRTTALGALLAHITGDAEAESYQPMNINFGLFPPLHEVKKKQRKEAYTERAKRDLVDWMGRHAVLAA
jgi:NAD(FAD)-utilizing enzyme possibly involved in translation